MEVQPNKFRVNDRSCAVFKIQYITCNFYHRARTLQIQGKEDADNLRNKLINLTSIRSHPSSETPNAIQEIQDKDVQFREETSPGLILPSDSSTAIWGNKTEGNIVKSPMLTPGGDLSKAEILSLMYKWKSFWTTTNLIIQIRSKIPKLTSMIIN